MLFSIAIPAYKAQYLEECLSSILSQTYPHYEVVIVDDASPEDLKSIVEKFNDSRIRYYRNLNNYGAINVVDNWNKCLEYCNGKYVICMGDDDRLTPHCLDNYVSLINKYPGLGLYHTQAEIIDGDSEFVDCLTCRPEFESAWSLMWHRWKGRKQYIGDFCYDTERIKRNGGFYKLPLAWASDDISAIIASRDTGVANTQVVGFQYRTNRQTISRTGNVQIKIAAMLEERGWYEQFLKILPENDQDQKYRKSALSMLPHYYKKKIIYTIVDDLNDGWFLNKAAKWFRLRKKYNISIKEYIYALITTIRVKNM